MIEEILDLVIELVAEGMHSRFGIIGAVIGLFVLLFIISLVI